MPESPPKTVVFGDNDARLYDRRRALAADRLAVLKGEYQAAGGERSNLRHGYVTG